MKRRQFIACSAVRLRGRSRRARSSRTCGHISAVERAGLLCRFYQETSMATGTVKWFNPTKGYGFIQPQGSGKH
jgi:hypothetical protein